jgi:multidrug efflux system outer membrane protein
MSSTPGFVRVLALAGGLAAALGACALKPPTITKPVLRAEAPISVASAAAASTSDAWPAADWWKSYGDPTLDGLIDLALRGAPSLLTADARLASARESVRVAGAAQGAQVTGDASFTRTRLSDNGIFPPQLLGFHWYNDAELGVNATYTFDWWGKQRANIAAAVDESRATQAERAAASLILSSAVADSYFGWQADQQRLNLARERLAIQEHQVRVTTLRVTAQLDNGDAARQLSQDEASTREAIAALEGSARLRVVTLAALLGRGADELPVLALRPLPDVKASLPESVRLDLIARRPDIAASRWRVEAAQQNLVSARAEYYPDVTIHALAGLSSIEIGKLLEAGSAAPVLGAAIHLPLFDSGLRGARFGARQAQVAAAVANYDETVVAAASEVATAASATLALQVQRQQRVLQIAAAQALTDSASARLRAGLIDVRSQLSTSLAVNFGQDALLQLNLAALSADVALRRALGGGFVAREETP